VPLATFTFALTYLPLCLTGLIPLVVIDTELDSVLLSANRSLVLTVNVAVASTIGLTPIILALSPGKGSSSEVSTSHSLAVPQKLAAL